MQRSRCICDMLPCLISLPHASVAVTSSLTVNCPTAAWHLHSLSASATCAMSCRYLVLPTASLGAPPRAVCAISEHAVVRGAPNTTVVLFDMHARCCLVDKNSQALTCMQHSARSRTEEQRNVDWAACKQVWSRFLSSELAGNAEKDSGNGHHHLSTRFHLSISPVPTDTKRRSMSARRRLPWCPTTQRRCCGAPRHTRPWGCTSRRCRTCKRPTRLRTHRPKTRQEFLANVISGVQLILMLQLPPSSGQGQGPQDKILIILQCLVSCCCACMHLQLLLSHDMS